MVEHQDVGDVVQGRESLMRRRTAIDADQQFGALVREAAQRVAVRSVPLQQAVRHMMHHPAAKLAQHRDHEGGATGAVDVIIAEHADAFAVEHRLRQPRRGVVHVDQAGRVGQHGAQRRVEKIRRLVQVHPARGQQPPDQFRDAQPLRDALAQPLHIARPPHPASARQALFYAQRTVIHHRSG